MFKRALVIFIFLFMSCERTTPVDQDFSEVFEEGKIPRLAELAANPVPLGAVEKNLFDPAKHMLVAVIDSGVDYNHPELKDKLAYRKNGEGNIELFGKDFLGNDNLPYHDFFDPLLFAFGAEKTEGFKIFNPQENPLKALDDINEEFMEGWIKYIREKIPDSIISEKISKENFTIWGIHKIALEFRDNEINRLKNRAFKKNGKLKNLRKVRKSTTWDQLSETKESRREKKKREEIEALEKDEELSDVAEFEERYMKRASLRRLHVLPWRMNHEYGYPQLSSYTGEVDGFLDSLVKVKGFRKFFYETYNFFLNYLERNPKYKESLITLFHYNQTLSGHGDYEVSEKNTQKVRESLFPVVIKGNSEYQIESGFLLTKIQSQWANYKNLGAGIEYQSFYNRAGVNLYSFYQGNCSWLEVYNSKNLKKITKDFFPTKAGLVEKIVSPYSEVLVPKTINDCFLTEREFYEKLTYGKGTFTPPYTQPYDPSSISDHGTHVAGTIAAQHEDIRIVPVRIHAQRFKHSEEKDEKIRKRYLQSVREIVESNENFMKYIEILKNERGQSYRKIGRKQALEDFYGLTESYLETQTSDLYFVDSVISAINWVGENKIPVANLSVGTSYETPKVDRRNIGKMSQLVPYLVFEIFKTLVRESFVKAGHTSFFIAAGNEGKFVDSSTHTTLPCDVSAGSRMIDNEIFSNESGGNPKNIVCVQSMTDDEETIVEGKFRNDRSNFSNFAPFHPQRIYAVGENILSYSVSKNCFGYRENVVDQLGGVLRDAPSLSARKLFSRDPEEKKGEEEFRGFLGSLIVLNGLFDCFKDFENTERGGVKTASGTSMASPHGAGSFARYFLENSSTGITSTGSKAENQLADFLDYGVRENFYSYLGPENSCFEVKKIQGKNTFPICIGPARGVERFRKFPDIWEVRVKAEEKEE